jgi:hypothetical protein
VWSPDRYCDIRSASRTKMVRIWPANCQPTTIRLETSTTKEHQRPPSSADTRNRRPTARWARRREVSVDQVGPPAGIGIRRGGRHGLPRCLALGCANSKFSRRSLRVSSRSPSLNTSFPPGPHSLRLDARTPSASQTDTQITRDMRNRAPRLKHQLRRALQQLLRVLPSLLAYQKALPPADETTKRSPLSQPARLSPTYFGGHPPIFMKSQ